MVAFKAVLAFATLALPAVQAGHIHARHDHSHVSRSALPGKWYHDDNHPAHKLFVRGPAPAGPPAFAPIGSPTWSANFPKGTPDASQLPKAWTDALNAAVAAGRIPNIPQTTSVDAGPPVYPTGFDPNSPQVCSAYYHTCRNKEDIYDAPDGFLGTSFDDGPLPDQVTLNNFLAQNNEKTTYFLIGVNMLAHPDILQATIDQGHDIAVHTWTHPQMTTLANIDVLAQLGWSVELIRNSTGGKIPRYWRPPTGDSDERVRAIAKEIFGLTTVIWNHDTFDWSLTQANGVTPPEIHANYTQWLAGPKSPGLVILEHVLSTGSVQAFIDAYPLVKQAGWKTGSLIKLTGDGSAFQAGVTAVIANPATIVRPSTTGVTILAPPATSSPTVLPAPASTSVVVVKPSTTSAATPAPSGNGAVATPARIFGSASVVVLTYLFSLLL